MVYTRGGRSRYPMRMPRLATWQPPSISYPLLTLQEAKDIRQNDQWIIQSIHGHSHQFYEPRSLPISPDFCFFVDWQDSSWDTSNATINALMQSKVCSLHSEPHQKFSSTFMHVACTQPQRTDQRLPRSYHRYSDGRWSQIEKSCLETNNGPLKTIQ